jgi:hypothetical protein
MIRLRLLLLLLALPAVAQDEAGRISAVVPTAHRLRQQQGKYVQQEAARDQTVAWNDIVRTTQRGRARLTLHDGSILSLGAGSQLRIVKHDARSQQTALELAYGRIRCRVEKLTRSAAASFQLRTPTAVAGVIGTDFGADASNPDETTLVCIDGTVRVTNSDPNVPGSVDCAAGMTTTVRRGQPPTAPVPATPEQLQRWQHINEPGDAQFARALPPVTAEQSFGIGASRDFPWLAQTSPVKPVRAGAFDISGSLRFRTEFWNWFDDGSAFDGSYAFAHSILRVGMGQRRRLFDWRVELAQPTLFGLPENAVAPAPQGHLGLGATYYVANDNNRNPVYAFPGQAYVRFKGLAGGDANQLTLGRFVFIEGLETMPTNRALQWLKRQRIAHRLIGDFGFSAVGRSADGAQLSWKLGASNLTLAAARPTKGVLQADGMGSLDIGYVYGALTVPTMAANQRSTGELRVFGIGYEDARFITKVDNRPLAVREGADRAANIRVGTFGAHYIHWFGSDRAGNFDLLFWGVAQTGDWGLQSHRAGAVAAEFGWQPSEWPLHPWLRAGYFYGSGDDDPLDARHSTFFPLLPTPRIYARYPFYNAQNSSDAHLMLILRPNARLTLRSEAHLLQLAQRNDLWYLGGGAYSRGAFGYQARPSGGDVGLARTWDLSADYRFAPRWTLGLYYAHARGGSVIRNIYPERDNSHFGFAEVTFQF